MKHPVSEFEPSEFDERYTFRNGKVYSRNGKPVRPQSRTNPQGTDYSYYHLTRNDGARVKVSASLVSGRVEKVGDLYMINHWPKGWEARAGFPSYLFHPTKHKVRRVAWLAPRTNPVDIQPNKCGQYRLHTPDGYRWFHRDDLFL